MTAGPAQEHAHRDCVFCGRVRRGEFEPTKLHAVVTFEPLNPVTPGHRLFIPRGHITAADSDPVLSGYVFEAASQYASTEPDAFNLITSSGSVATQTIEHMHVHYVPRREGDGLHLPWTNQGVSS